MPDWSEEEPTFDLVRQMVTVEEVAELLGLEVVNNKIRSPFNPDDNTPSCHLWDEHFYCFSTGKGGDVVDLVVAVTGKTPGQALRAIWNRALRAGKEPGDVERSTPRALDNFYDAIPWDNAGDKHFIHTCEKLVPEGCDYQNLMWRQLVVPSHEGLLVPHWTTDGSERTVHGVKIRRFDGAKAAWTGSQFTAQLYRCCLRRNPRACWITEGESDAWALMEVDTRNNIFALPSGANCWRDSWLEQLQPYETVAIVMDNDRAGEQAREKLRSKVGWGRLKDVQVPTLYNDLREALVAGWEPPTL